MFLRNMRSSTVMRFGLIALVAASLSSGLFRRAAPTHADLVDGIDGFLYGVAIATLLLSLWMGRRDRERQAPR